MWILQLHPWEGRLTLIVSLHSGVKWVPDRASKANSSIIIPSRQKDSVDWNTPLGREGGVFVQWLIRKSGGRVWSGFSRYPSGKVAAGNSSYPSFLHMELGWEENFARSTARHKLITFHDLCVSPPCKMTHKRGPFWRFTFATCARCIYGAHTDAPNAVITGSHIPLLQASPNHGTNH